MCIPHPVLKAVSLHAINSIFKNQGEKPFSLGQQIASVGSSSDPFPLLRQDVSVFELAALVVVWQMNPSDEGVPGMGSEAVHTALYLLP